MTTTITTYLESQAIISSMRLIGGDDADINSQDGRETQVNVRSLSPRVNSERTMVYLTIIYEVIETHKNYTHLQGETTISVQADYGARILSAGWDAKDVRYHGSFRTEDHSWHTISDEPGVSGSYFKSLRIKFDGKGRDDHGNAQLDGIVVIPVTVEIAEEHSTIPISSFNKIFKVNSSNFRFS